MYASQYTTKRLVHYSSFSPATQQLVLLKTSLPQVILCTSSFCESLTTISKHVQYSSVYESTSQHIHFTSPTLQETPCTSAGYGSQPTTNISVECSKPYVQNRKLSYNKDDPVQF